MKNLLLILLFFLSVLSGGEPIAVYTLLEDHPDENMTVQWITTDDQKKSLLQYCELGSTQWYEIKGSKKSVPGSSDILVHRVALTQLKPETTYQFKLHHSEVLHNFRTLPNGLSRPVSFVVGGDIYHDTIDIVRKMNRVAASHNPDFALLGGDIAYTNSRFSLFPEKLVVWTQRILSKLHLGTYKQARWIEWLRAWSEEMVTDDGRKIPLFATIGNHDVDGGFNQTGEEAKAFYTLFLGDSPTVYRTIDFGKDLSIIALDSGHTAQIGGAQSLWLYKTLQDRKTVSRKFAFYHTPAYPSCRDFNFKQATLIRRYWVPYFEAFNVDAAFEHHDHAYKRTVPIRQGKEDPHGVLYFGDGAWGVKSPRRPKSGRWYVAHSAQSRNVIHVTVEKDRVSYTAYNDEDKVIDSLGGKVGFDALKLITDEPHAVKEDIEIFDIF